MNDVAIFGLYLVKPLNDKITAILSPLILSPLPKLGYFGKNKPDIVVDYNFESSQSLIKYCRNKLNGNIPNKIILIHDRNYFSIKTFKEIYKSIATQRLV